MEKLGKLLEFIKENRMLERYNKRTGEWEQVEIDLSDPEILETLMVMSAEMTIEIKDLGSLDRYNGVDVTQTRDFVKLSNKTYMQRVLDGHAWLLNDTNISNKPIPIHSEHEYSRACHNR